MKTLGAFIFLLSFILSGCKYQESHVTNHVDFDKYLSLQDNKAVDFANSEIKFWQNKYDASPIQTLYLTQISANNSSLFEATGNIEFLYKTEKLLLKANEVYKYTHVGPIRSLARNYISQHRFQEALELAQKALAIGEGLHETRKLLFDVNMELGNYTYSNKILKDLSFKPDFDYYIRSAKWEDHLGNLEKAISLMELAKLEAEKYDNTTLKIWSYTNLGDFYGHAGRINDSYRSYLKTLEIDPNNTYAMKGIAWICFSHEKNFEEANRIVDKLLKTHETPDFFLLKSQIAECAKQSDKQAEYLGKYFQKLKANNYGAMYNKYNTLIYADDKQTAGKALEIAKVEVEHRPTPDSYDLLAWAYLNSGNPLKAMEIAEQYVKGKSFEPRVTYHMAMIDKANNKIENLPAIKKELLSSCYELGPNMEQKITAL